jgi:hypothetical protein
LYDSEVGRFLVVDPLGDKMPGWSGYSYSFNNPVQFIDPNGMAPKPPHDYFDGKGNYLGSDKRGNEVRIVGDNAIKHAESMSGNAKFDHYSRHSTPFSDYLFTSREYVGKIGQFYFNEYLGCNDVKVEGIVGASFDIAMTFKGGTDLYKKGDYFFANTKPIIGIGMGLSGRPMSKFLNNKFNFINLL